MGIWQKASTEKKADVYHDKGSGDLQKGKMDRSKAYNYALEGLNQILAKYPSIQVILDIHRDGVGEKCLFKTDDKLERPPATSCFLTRPDSGRSHFLSSQSLQGRKSGVQLENAVKSRRILSGVYKKNIFKRPALQRTSASKVRPY